MNVLGEFFKNNVFFLIILLSIIIIILPIIHTFLLNMYYPVNYLVQQYRLYRAIYIVISGIALSYAGCLLQSTLRNPLVDHYILGIGSGALLATYLCILITGYNVRLIATVAIIGGLLALFLTTSLAEYLSGSDVAYVLAGMSINSLFSGLSILLSYYVVTRYPYASILLVGGFTLSRPGLLPYLLPLAIVVIPTYFILAKRLNVVLLGDEYAMQLGVNPRTTRLISSIISGCIASMVVAFFGIIGFIGLMTPHVSRFLLKTSDNRLVIPMALGLGVGMLYLTDLLSRSIAAPVIGEIPSGAVVSAIGAPFFTLLLIRRFKRGF
ncbi:MAG: iron ABC transporter permease [Desulfurococcaceae archaeon]